MRVSSERLFYGVIIIFEREVISVPVTLKDVLELPPMGKAKVIAGRKGLSQVITRPIIGHIDYTSEVFGGELLFIVGNGFRADEGTLKSLISESNFNGLSGIVFSVPSDYFPAIDENVISFAESLEFPLFQIPWNSNLTEIAGSIESLIKSRSDEDELLHTLMEKIMCTDDDETGEIKKRIESLGYNSSCAYQACIVKISRPQGYMSDDVNHMNYVHLYIRNLIEKRCAGSMTMSRRDDIVVFAPIFGGKKIVSELAGIRDLVITHFPGIHLGIGIGKPTGGIEFLKRSLIEAEKSFKNRYEQRASEYGMLNLFYSAFNINEVEVFCDKNIGKLIDYDKLNGSELIRTVEVYYENKFNLSRTAKELMIHRNSLMYRLRRIEEITGRSLDDPYVLLDVINSIYINKAMLSFKNSASLKSV